MNNFAGFASVCRPDNTARFHIFHKARSAVIADFKPALNIRSRCFSGLHNDFERFIVQGIFSFAEYARIETFIFIFNKNLIVDIFRLAVLFYEFDDVFNFGIGHKGSLYADRERNFRARVQHIALTQKFFRADLIDDNAAVHFRSDHKRNAAGNVRLYKTGNNVDRRTLSRQY